ncbi:formate dehydrogenase subunit alpha [Methanocella sp. MCL-LM]|uniref:formate dehydrogenase subunit alpha n=1 Tax=Methanocella sp. MCL-LM TaxID=3412035 RepID=UPI003C78F853
MNLKLVSTICPYCGCGCGINLVEKDGKVVGVEPWKRHPVNEGKLCPKGNFAHEFIHRNDRLTTPLIKKDGKFVPASWDEAISLVASKFKEINSQFGPESMACFASARVTNEENFVMQKFARVALKTPNIDHCARLCHGTSVAGLAKTLGSGAMTNTIKDIADAKLLFIIGTNTFEDHPLIGRRIVQAKERGAKIIVCDPRFNITAKQADIFVQHRSGTDVALLNAMMYTILTEGLENKEFIKARTKDFETIKAEIMKCSPEWAEPITGVPADTIKKIARMYATSGASSILFSMGITQHACGTDNVVSVSNLALMCGMIGKPGTGINPLRGQNNVQGACDMGCLPNVVSGYQAVINDELRKKYAAAWGVADLPNKVGLTIVEVMNAIDAGKVKSLYIMGENPMVSDPDINHVKHALQSVNFLVVQDIFMTETAELAHVVLPAAAYAEKEGTFTSTERRVQLLKKVVTPPGQAKEDWEIICAIAKKMGVAGFDFKSAGEIFEEVRKVTPQYAGMTWERLKKPEALHWPCPATDHPGTPILHTVKFTHPDGLGIFFPVSFKPPAEVPDAEYPLLLTTGRMIFHYHTGSMTRRSATLDSEVKTGFVEINPVDAKALGVKMGDKVKVASRRGEIEIAAKVTPNIMKGIIFIPFHFHECSANILTNPALDPFAKMPELKACAAKIIPIPKEDKKAAAAPVKVAPKIGGH